MLLTIIIFILTLLTLVVVHEFGHFLVARKFGIKVLEFGFGIPPRAWGKKVGETIVSVNWLPIGGFVSLLGEDETGKGNISERDFRAKRVEQRIAVVVAGVVMNLLLAWLLFYLVLGASGFKTRFPLLADHQFLGTQQNEQYILVDQVAEGSPAQMSGLKVGDRILALNGQTTTEREQLINQVKDQAGKEIRLTVKNEKTGRVREVLAIPRVNPPAGEGPLGVALGEIKVANVSYSGAEKLLAAPIHSANIITYSAKILGSLVGQSVKQKSFEPVSTSVAGPVGITNMANTILTSTTHPLLPYLDFMGILSLNLAVFNLLPIPALDGGRLFFLLIEALTRKKVHAGFEKWVHTIGMAFLLALTLLITFSDIRKFF